MIMSKYTQEQLQAAREYAAQVHKDLAKHCLGEDFGFAEHVTEIDKRAYRAKQLQIAEDIEAGHCDDNFTVVQRIHYFLTGESIALLP